MFIVNDLAKSKEAINTRNIETMHKVDTEQKTDAFKIYFYMVSGAEPIWSFATVFDRDCAYRQITDCKRINK